MAALTVTSQRANESLPQLNVDQESNFVGPADKAMQEKIDMYQEISNRFQDAALPEFDTQLKGWHVGRCYDEAGRIEKANILLADTRTNMKDGPIGAFAESKAYIIWAEGKSAHYFDRMTAKKERQLKTVIDRSVFKNKSITPVKALSGSLVSYLMGSDTYAVKNEFRTDSEYIYARYEDDSQHTYYCYYYDDVAPEL